MLDDEPKQCQMCGCDLEFLPVVSDLCEDCKEDLDAMDLEDQLEALLK